MTPITLEVLEAVRTVLADGDADGAAAQDDVMPAPAAVVPAPREPLARRRRPVTDGAST